MKRFKELFVFCLFCFLFFLSTQLRADHHTGGEIRYYTKDSVNGSFKIEIIIDRYCTAKQYANELIYKTIEYDGTAYIEKTRSAKYLKSEYIQLPCSSDTLACQSNTQNKIERRYYYDTPIIQKSDKECIVYYSGSVRSYSDNLANPDVNMLLYLSFYPKIYNTSIQLSEIQRQSLVTNTLNTIEYATTDAENDSIGINSSRPYINLTSTISGSNLSYTIEKGNMNLGSLTDARPLEIAESGIDFTNNTISLTPTRSMFSWMTLLKKEFRKINNGAKDTTICISTSNIERLIVSSSINTQLSLNNVKSTATNVKISGLNVTICNQGNVSAIKYYFPIEKSVNLNNYKCFLGGTDYSSASSMMRIAGASIDTLVLSFNYSPLGMDIIHHIKFFLSACHTSTNTSFTKNYTATIEEFNYKIFKSDTILSCSPTAKIPLMIKKSVVFSYGVRVSANPEDFLSITNPKDTWIIGTLSNVNASCPSRDSIYLNQGSLYSTNVNSYSPTCSKYCDGQAKIKVTGTNGPYKYYWQNGSTLDSIASLCPGIYKVEIKDIDNCIQYDTAKIMDLKGIDGYWNIDTVISCYGSANGRGHIAITSTLKPTSYSWNHTSMTDSFLSGMNVGTYSGVYKYVNQNGKNCDQIFSFFINQPDSVHFEYVVNHNTCFGEKNGKIAISPNGGNGPYRYFINDSLNSNGLFTNLSNGLYRIVVKDNKNCSSSIQSITVTSPPKIEVKIDLTPSSCDESKNGKLTISNPMGGIMPFTYGILNQMMDSGFTFKNLAKGTYLLKVMDANNCTMDTNVEIVSSYILQASIDSVLHSRCPKSSTGYISLRMKTGIGPFEYDNNGNKIITPSASWTFINLKKGAQNISIFDDNLCSWDTLINIAEPDTLKIISTIKNVTCYDGNDGKIETLITGGSPPYRSFTWSMLGNPISSNENLKPGKYTMKFQDSLQCIYEREFEILNKPEYKLQLHLTKPISCFGYKNGEIKASVIGGNAPYTYYFQNTPLSSEYVSNIQAGTYYVSVEDRDNCKANQSITVIEPSKLVFDEIKIDNLDCASTSRGVISIFASGGTISNLQFYRYAIDTAQGYSLSNIFYNLRLGKYTLSIKDINQCKTDTSFELIDSKRINIKLPPSIKLNLGETIQLNPEFIYAPHANFQDIRSILWSPSIGLNCTDCAQPRLTAFKSNKYNIQINYGTNCVTEAQMNVEVSAAEDIYIPNSFSPNSDSKNDEWRIYGSNVTNLNIFVYDRTGEMVFRSDDINRGWDGYHKGEPCKIDAYTYLIRAVYADGSSKQYTEILNLIR